MSVLFEFWASALLVESSVPSSNEKRPSSILTRERSEISVVLVCELAVEIIEAQRREIQEMSWLIDDIDDHGPGEDRDEADGRPVPVVRRDERPVLSRRLIS